MSVSRVCAGAMAIAAAAAVSLSDAAPAGAGEQWGINGTFATSSNGVWAKVNDRYEDQPRVVSTWTISTQCISPTECSGTVNSDAGWSAPIYTTNGLWYVKRVVPNWRFCADGTPVDGLQLYRIYPVGFDGHVDQSSDEYTGEDVTSGPSGSCGRNQPPVIKMPFYMRPA